MKKLLSLVLVAIMCLGLFAGCAGGEKGSVYWLNFKPESDEVLQEVAKMYTEKTGVEVKVITAASGTYNQTLIAEMDKSDAPTLFVIGNQNAVKEWKDYALNLKDSAIAKELNTDAYNMYDADGKFTGFFGANSVQGTFLTVLTRIKELIFRNDQKKSTCRLNAQ